MSKRNEPLAVRHLRLGCSCPGQDWTRVGSAEVEATLAKAEQRLDEAWSKPGSAPDLLAVQ